MSRHNMRKAHIVVLKDKLISDIVSISCQADARRMTSLTAVRFNVDHISWKHFLLLQAVIDCGVQLELLSALHCLQANDDMCDDFAIPSCLHNNVFACNVLYTLHAKQQSRHPAAVAVSSGGRFEAQKR